MGVDLSKWGWTKWIGMPVDLRRQPFGLVFSLRNFKNICRQVGVSLARTLAAQDNPADLWHLRHWLQFWQLRPWIHDNFCYLTIKSDSGQHSQFLRCFKNQWSNIFLKSQWSKDIIYDILDCQIHKYTNTSTQIHKYTNTAFEKGSEIPYIYLYFWKANDPRTSKMIFWTVKYTNTQIQRHKYTNSLGWSARNTQHVLYFWKARGPRTSKMICWTVKNTNTQEMW